MVGEDEVVRRGSEEAEKDVVRRRWMWSRRRSGYGGVSRRW